MQYTPAQRLTCLFTLFLALAFGGFCRAQESEQNLHLILLAGQSNMAGRGKVEPQDQQPHPRIKMLSAEGRWVPATAPVHFDKPGMAGVGIARSFALRYLESNPDATVGLVPCAVGGSSIDAWQPGGFHKQTRTHPFDDATQRIRTALQSGTFRALLWHQGESDCKPAAVSSYSAKLTQTISLLRKEMRDATLPVIIGGLGRFEAKPWNAARYEIDLLHKQIAEQDPNAAFVWSTGLTAKQDNTHFNSASYRELGERYHLALQSLLSQREGRGDPELLSVERIWDETTHSAFTDLVSHRGKAVRSVSAGDSPCFARWCDPSTQLQ